MQAKPQATDPRSASTFLVRLEEHLENCVQCINAIQIPISSEQQLYDAGYELVEKCDGEE